MTITFHNFIYDCNSLRYSKHSKNNNVDLKPELEIITKLPIFLALIEYDNYNNNNLNVFLATIHKLSLHSFMAV